MTTRVSPPINTRIAHPDLQKSWSKLSRQTQASAGEAYRQIVSWHLLHPGDARDRRDMRRVAGAWFVGDPAAAAASAIPESLLQPALALDAGLPTDTAAVAATFWGTRTAVALCKEPGLPTDRDTELVELLQSALGQPPDRGMDADALEKQTVPHWRGATMQPSRGRRLPSHSSSDACIGSSRRNRPPSFDDTTLQRLDAELLAELLPALGERWEDFRDVLRRTTRTDDSFVALKMLDVFRGVSDERLRNFLAGYFYERVGSEPGTLTEEELIDALRRAVGVAAREENLERWNTLAGRAEELLVAKTAADAQPVAVLQQTLERRPSRHDGMCPGARRRRRDEIRRAGDCRPYPAGRDRWPAGQGP